MDELAAQAIRAHGGLARWRRFTLVNAHQVVDGELCRQKAQPGLVNDVYVTVALQRQWASLAPLTGPAYRSRMEPQLVAIENLSGRVMAERRAPRLSFRGHTRQTPWDTLQLAYFMGYSMWTYLTLPFLFAMPGVHCAEVAPWDEYGERWRRLRVRFPATLASHCREQVFYFDAACLLQRLDYDIDVAGRLPVAHYVAEHREVSGIIVPTCHLMLNRLPDNSAAAEPTLASIKLDHIKFM